MKEPGCFLGMKQQLCLRRGAVGPPLTAPATPLERDRLSPLTADISTHSRETDARPGHANHPPGRAMGRLTAKPGHMGTPEAWGRAGSQNL